MFSILFSSLKVFVLGLFMSCSSCRVVETKHASRYLVLNLDDVVKQLNPKRLVGD